MGSIDTPEPRRHLPVLRLSKSRYTVGLQCHRRLWWTVHEPDAPELVIDPALQAIFTQGHRVGEAARERFPGGVLVDLEHWKVSERVEVTAAALRAGASVVYEASFSADNVFVAVDVLHRSPDRDGWTLTEVKSTASVKDEHVLDAAVQAHVVRAAGLPVSRVEVMHLNRECKHPDLSNLFIRADVTERVKEFLPHIPDEVSKQLAMLGRDQPPEVATGPHCSEPWECPFMERCWPTPPEHAIGTLYASPKKRAALVEEGYDTILDLPDDVPLQGIADRQRRAVQSGSIVVDPGLSEALAVIVSPVAHLDFETIGPAIPVWPGCSPYDAVPVQFSVRIKDERGGPSKEIAWLAHGPADPRPAVACALIDALGGTGSVVVYNKGFESGRLRELAEAVPDLAPELLAIEARLVDLLPIVRGYVYHPAFGGSFSLKAVAPALVPGFGYEDLDVGDGGAASSALAAVILDGEPADDVERAALRRTLLAYCARDTLGTVGVLERLRGLA
jgi:hypothetical protein